MNKLPLICGFQRNENGDVCWKPQKLNEWVYFWRYWLGFYIMPKFYKDVLVHYNNNFWTQANEEFE